MDRLIMTIASDLRELKRALNIVLTQIKTKNPQISEEDFMDLRLIFSELMSNAIIHGNKHDVHKKVCVVIDFMDNRIISNITDEGNGFDYVEILKPRDPCDDFLSEHGRGIKLASVLADELMFYGKGNEIIFSKKFDCLIPENKSACKHHSNEMLVAAI